jgi:hypothetical protein
MRNIIKKIISEEVNNLLTESGIRNIKSLAKRYPMAKIYFHIDLDGVTTALAMKKYLEDNGIKVVDAETIQYGDKEFSVKKIDAEGDIMPVLVDFAHGKPMFVIHTDHHDSQAGVEKGTSTSFKSSRSNVETISQSLSPKEIFTPEDIELISIVDSADYARHDISPEEVMSYLFKIDKERDVKYNKRKLGLIVNKLLLAYKNKPNFLRDIVLNAEPTLMSILINIKNQIKEKGYSGIENLERNKEMYVSSMKSSPNVKLDDNIIVQYGGGSMIKPGSYDRYTPFRNNPNADFIVLAWPMGLLQASCNPFKKDRALKGVNLGEIKDEVLSKWENQLKDRKIPLSTIKWVSESGKDFGEDSVGFTLKDFIAIYGNKLGDTKDSKNLLNTLDVAMRKPFDELTESEFDLMDSISVSAWDLINSNSGGHKCITNISGLSYLGRSKRPPINSGGYGKKDDDVAYVKFLKMLQSEFVRVLKEKITQSGNDRVEPNYEIEVMENVKRYTKSQITKRK